MDIFRALTRNLWSEPMDADAEDVLMEVKRQAQTLVMLSPHSTEERARMVFELWL